MPLALESPLYKEANKGKAKNITALFK